MALILEIKGVSKRFGGFKALDDVTLHVARGDIMGLLGPNGAGKSTLIKISLGLMRRDSGIVLLRGLDPFSDPDARKGVGVIFERPMLPESLTIEDFLRRAARIYGSSDSDVRGVLKQLGLESHAWKTFGELSAGLKQRAAIAHALLSNPEFIMADEPTSNLDPVERLKLLRLIEELNRDHGITFLVSSHIIHEVSRISSTLVVLNRGRVIARGSPQDLVMKAPIARVRSQNPEGLASILRGEGYDVAVEGLNVMIRLKSYSDNAALLETLSRASRAGVTVLGVDIIGAGLEELLRGEAA
ncbi:MAG: ABC transporter ATP-binding protein [Thermoprotei archaeon]|nr:ABC transporter ATP-binding protein [Thermoprotei archaeon]